MARNLENPSAADRNALSDENPNGTIQNAQADDGSPAAAPSAAPQAEAFLAAADDCAVTDQQTVLR
ncbi:MAG: hypothetical protein ACR2P3_08315, partial [Geminicoccaceae bacterium]